jgi:D-glycero-alpha-D-manno-heptose-7-phosphate kinase
MIISQTPLRLSFFGGNTDFREYYLKYGGCVLDAAIDKYIYCIAKKRFDDLIYVNYTEKEIVEKVDDIKHPLVREALRLVGITKGIEISFLADIPSHGSGLGSSSAVTVGVLNALHAFKGEYVGSDRLAEEAVKIELDILKNPIGVQDQYAVSLGGIRLIFFDPSGVSSKRIEISESLREDFNNSLMLLYTGVGRSTNQILSSVNLEKKNLDKKKALAIIATERLTTGHLRDFGKMLGNSWATKKSENNKTTTHAIDLMYDSVIKSGAIGGKIIGAGGGGFLLVMFPANKRAQIRKSLKEYKEMPFRFCNFGSRIIFNV